MQQTTESHQILVEAAEDELVGLWDTMRLARVLGNLLDNAIKYSPAGGTITVALPWHKTCIEPVKDTCSGTPCRGG